MDGYSATQKQELSLLFAKILHEFHIERDSGFMSELAKKLYVETAKLSWFYYRGNEHGVLKHLEEAGVYGVFQFIPEKRVSLYVRAVFSDEFARWVNTQRPTQEKFIRAWPKSRACKPNREVVLGNVSSVGKARTNLDNIGLRPSHAKTAP